LVVTYTDVANFPRFLVQFSDWNLHPKLPASEFAFTPPPNSKQIEFLSPIPAPTPTPTGRKPRTKRRRLIMNGTKFVLILTSVIVALSASRPAHAWVAAHAGGVGCYHGAYASSGYASGYRGSAEWSHGTGYAAGSYGGSASWSHGSGSATGSHGGTASWSGGSGSYHGAYGGAASWSR
jgi:hypothetical protein